MINLLKPLWPSRIFRDAVKHSPIVRGRLTVETRERGKLRQRFVGDNIWTLTGREFLVELMSLQDVNPRTTYREDRVGYIGVGTGAQAEVATVTSLVEPVPYKEGEFLAQLIAPASFPSSGTTTAKTSVQYIREFGRGEISLGYTVVLTEAGLFTDGDPDNSWDLDTLPTSFATASGRAPNAYKNIDPITKSVDMTLRTIWEVGIV